MMPAVLRATLQKFEQRGQVDGNHPSHHLERVRMELSTGNDRRLYDRVLLVSGRSAFYDLALQLQSPEQLGVRRDDDCRETHRYRAHAHG